MESSAQQALFSCHQLKRKRTKHGIKGNGNTEGRTSTGNQEGDPGALYDQYLEARKAVEAMFTKADWEFVPGDLRTKLILQEMRKQGNREDGSTEKPYTQAELEEAVALWTDRQSGNIRAYQNGRFGESDEPFRKRYGDLSEMIERYIKENGTYAGVLYRWINVSESVAKFFVEHQIIKQNGTSSWSRS